jgi:hypothetical protein
VPPINGTQVIKLPGRLGVRKVRKRLRARCGDLRKKGRWKP